jgi:PLP dependent protein
MRVTVVDRLNDIRSRVQAASKRAAFDSPVTLVAVSKTQPSSAIREAYAAGQRDFGENYVQELVAKAKELSDLADLRWHFIGHLQRNKVKDVLPIASLVQTVDRIELAQEIGKRATKPTAVLIEVNLAGEEQKAGASVAALPELIAAIRALPQLELRGLMAVPPAADDPELTRPYFRQLRELARAHEGAAPFELSMGMSGDFEVAVEEGASIVRVGSSIFGSRVR